MMCVIVKYDSCLLVIAIICKLILFVSEKGNEIFYMIEAAVRLPSNATFKRRSLPGVMGLNRERKREKYKVRK